MHLSKHELCRKAIYAQQPSLGQVGEHEQSPFIPLLKVSWSWVDPALTIAGQIIISAPGARVDLVLLWPLLLRCPLGYVTERQGGKLAGMQAAPRKENFKRAVAWIGAAPRDENVQGGVAVLHSSSSHTSCAMYPRPAAWHWDEANNH